MGYQSMVFSVSFHLPINFQSFVSLSKICLFVFFQFIIKRFFFMLCSINTTERDCQHVTRARSTWLPSAVWPACHEFVICLSVFLSVWNSICHMARSTWVPSAVQPTCHEFVSKESRIYSEKPATMHFQYHACSLHWLDHVLARRANFRLGLLATNIATGNALVFAAYADLITCFRVN
jgi:hypothetical protein